MSGYNQIYLSLKPFILNWRAAAAQQEGSAAPQPFIITADVARAFDCINACQLMPLLDRLLQSPQYTLIKYVEVSARVSWFPNSQKHASCC